VSSISLWRRRIDSYARWFPHEFVAFKKRRKRSSCQSVGQLIWRTICLCHLSRFSFGLVTSPLLNTFSLWLKLYFGTNLPKQMFSCSSNMLLNENLMGYLRLHIQAQNIYGTSSFRFHSSQKLVHSTNREVKNEFCKIMAYFLIILIAFGQVIFAARNVPLVVGFENFFSVTAAFVVCLLKWTAYNKNDDIIELFNMFTYFETRNTPTIMNLPQVVLSLYANVYVFRFSKNSNHDKDKQGFLHEISPYGSKRLFTSYIGFVVLNSMDTRLLFRCNCGLLYNPRMSRISSSEAQVVNTL